MQVQVQPCRLHSRAAPTPAQTPPLLWPARSGAAPAPSRAAGTPRCPCAAPSAASTGCSGAHDVWEAGQAQVPGSGSIAQSPLIFLPAMPPHHTLTCSFRAPTSWSVGRRATWRVLRAKSACASCEGSCSCRIINCSTSSSRRYLLWVGVDAGGACGSQCAAGETSAKAPECANGLCRHTLAPPAHPASIRRCASRSMPTTRGLHAHLEKSPEGSLVKV